MIFSILASLNLPAAIEVTDGGSALPPSILEKANAVSQLGGISELERMITELPDSLKRNQDILNEVCYYFTIISIYYHFFLCVCVDRLIEC